VFEKMVECHVRHLADSHFKVVIACLNSIAKMFTFYKDRIVPHIDEVLPKLLNCLTDPNEKLHKTANFLMNIIQKLFSGDQLLDFFLKALETANRVKIRICVLEILNVIVKNCSGYFSSKSNVKGCLKKVVFAISEH